MKKSTDVINNPERTDSPNEASANPLTGMDNYL